MLLSASGKSSNRHYEYGLGYSGGGHGVYAEEGRRDRARADACHQAAITAPRVASPADRAAMLQAAHAASKHRVAPDPACPSCPAS